MTATAIPIANLFYLFCYAWEHFKEADVLEVGAEDSPNLQSLLAKVLISGVQLLMRRGLDRRYSSQAEDLAGIRGRVDLTGTIRLQMRRSKRVSCEFDELTYDTLENQILRAALTILTRVEGVDVQLKKTLLSVIRQMPQITDIALTRHHFSRIQVHRNNSYYSFLLKVALLVFECRMPAEGHGRHKFVDVLHDEVRMSQIFEAFIRNFYRREQEVLRLKPLQLDWASGNVGQDQYMLPKMVVDVFLSNQERNIIIDAKYYREVLQSHHGVERVRSAHLYQLFSYLRNAAASDAAYEDAEGILIYPMNGREVDVRVGLHRHPVRVATVDLSRPWPQIANRLLAIISTVGRLMPSEFQ